MTSKCIHKFLASFITVISMFTSSAFAENECINVGVLGDYQNNTSGFFRKFGKEVYDGASIAISQINQNDKHTCINLVPLDTQNSLANISPIIETSIQNNIDFFIGLPVSREAILAIKPLTKNNKLLFSQASADALSESNRVFTFIPTDTQISEKIISYLIEKKAKKVIVIHPSDNNITEIASHTFQKIYQEKTGQTPQIFSIRPDNLSLAPYIDEIKAINPSHIFLPMRSIDSAKAMLQLQENGIDATMMLWLSWNSYPFNAQNSSITFLKGSNIKAVAPIMYDARSSHPENIIFVKKFKEKFNRNPTNTEANSYLSILLLHKMLAFCHSTQILKQPNTCLNQSLPFHSVNGIITKQNHLIMSSGLTLKEVVFDHAAEEIFPDS